jgi:hypothetical protein
LNGVVATNVDAVANGGTTTGGGSDTGMSGSRPESDESVALNSEAGGSSDQNKQSAYGTHNQEAGVEEGDIIVSNGEIGM